MFTINNKSNIKNFINEFEEKLCNNEVPSKFNIYKWIRENKETAIAQAFFRTRRIMNRADYIQINISGGKDSTLTFHIAMLELEYRKELIKFFNMYPSIKANLNYNYETNIDIGLNLNNKDKKSNNDYEEFINKDNEYYNSFENINNNIPFIYINSQDSEIIFSDAINHIKNDIILQYGYGLYMFNNKIVCGNDIVPKSIRNEFNLFIESIFNRKDKEAKSRNNYRNENNIIVETYSDLWNFISSIDFTSVEFDHFINREKELLAENNKEIISIETPFKLTEEEINKDKTFSKINKDLKKNIINNKYKYCGYKAIFKLRDKSNINFYCLVRGNCNIHPFYKCLSISYQNGSSYNIGRFTAWDITKENIWCRELPKRENFGCDIITNYNMKNVNYISISKLNKNIIELNKDSIVDIDGIKCIPNWGFGSKSLCFYDKNFKSLYGSLMIRKNNEYEELWTYVGQNDEDANGSEAYCFTKWIYNCIPDEMSTDYKGNGEFVKHPTQLYSLVSIRAAESFDRYIILKQSNYFTGQYSQFKE